MNNEHIIIIVAKCNIIVVQERNTIPDSDDPLTTSNGYNSKHINRLIKQFNFVIYHTS